MNKKLTSLLSEINTLFASRGFKLLNLETTGVFDNWVATFGSDNFKVRIRSDRGQIFLAIGPKLASNKWEENSHYFDLGIVLTYITGNEDFYLKQEPEHSNIAIACAALLGRVMDHHSEISSIFSQENFPGHEDSIKRLGFQLFLKYKDFLISRAGGVN